MRVPDHLVPSSSEAARLRVGARQLDPATWVSDRDDDWVPTVAMKRALLAERPAEVVACLAGAEEACDEVAAGVLGSVGESPTTETGLDALVDAASRVADDLCILMPGRDGRPVLSAAALCSPNRWRLAEKLGSTMAGIHAPVARYETDLARPADAVMARLAPGKPVWRSNWGLSTHAALFQPDVPPVETVPPAEMWLRIEWQTLRRLPVTGGILFTIRTWVETLADFATRDPSVVQDFADLVAKIPDEVAVYKSIAPHRDAVFAWLESTIRRAR